uniref:Uncharacterized protein n=1 Tax=Knipowitschia caucasica TaxID=637954 RepID=A0AAV2JVC0_KNICA
MCAVTFRVVLRSRRGELKQRSGGEERSARALHRRSHRLSDHPTTPRSVMSEQGDARPQSGHGPGFTASWPNTREGVRACRKSAVSITRVLCASAGLLFSVNPVVCHVVTGS